MTIHPAERSFILAHDVSLLLRLTRVVVGAVVLHGDLELGVGEIESSSPPGHESLVLHNRLGQTRENEKEARPALRWRLSAFPRAAGDLTQHCRMRACTVLPHINGSPGIDIVTAEHRICEDDEINEPQ